MRSDRAVLVMLAISFIFVTTLVFVESLPTWCANPSAPGNWIVVGLCK